MKHLSGAPLKGWLLALPTNNRLGWNGLPGAKTLAYYENLLLNLFEIKIDTFYWSRKYIFMLWL